MRNRILYTILIVLLMGITNVMAAPQPGAVQACDSTGNDVNLVPGTLIYYKGVNLAENSATSWEIYDKGVTCPPESVIPGGIGCAKLLASGTGGTTNPDGSINPPTPTTWSIPAGDYPGHPYRLIVTIGPNSSPYEDFYTKNDSFEPVPELGSIVLTSAGLFGLLVISKRYRGK